MLINKIRRSFPKVVYLLICGIWGESEKSKRRSFPFGSRRCLEHAIECIHQPSLSFVLEILLESFVMVFSNEWHSIMPLVTYYRYYQYSRIRCPIRSNRCTHRFSAMQFIFHEMKLVPPFHRNDVLPRSSYIIAIHMNIQEFMMNNNFERFRLPDTISPFIRYQ